MIVALLALRSIAAHVTIAWACAGNSYMMLEPTFDRWEHCTPSVWFDDLRLLPLVEPEVPDDP